MKKLILLLIILTACTKKEQQPSIQYENNIKLEKCSNWVGTWFSFDGDTIMKDSIVIELDYYGFKNNQSYVQYKCNIKELDSLLWHYCPYDNPWDDDIHLVYKGKNMYFRYFH